MKLTHISFNNQKILLFEFRQLDDNSEMIPVLENETIAQPKPTKTENICSICNKTFLKRKSLERHKAMHEKDKTNDTTYQCTVCGSYQF